MRHPLLLLADKERLTDELERSLNSAKVSATKAKDTPRKLSDGGGLFLFIPPKNSASKPRRLWRYKYRIHGREGLFALGPFPEIGLADARRIHLAARWLVERGIHPAHYVREQRQRLETEERQKKTGTFASVCAQWLERDKAKLAAGSLAQRKRELKNDVLPALGGRQIAEIRKDELTALLQKIEKRAPEVARNVRFYLTGIFDYAVDAGLIAGSPVPGNRVLRARNQKPHPALAPGKIKEFLGKMDASGCNRQTAIAVRLLMLTAVRKHELLHARKSEFDLDAAEWNVPAGRMKMRRAHWVPLSRQVVRLLRELFTLSDGELLFPNVRDPRKPMSGNSLNALLGRLGYLAEAKPHGFRAMFSTFYNEAGWNPDVIERFLAHASKDRTRAKYDRSEHRGEQQKLAQHWANTVDALVAGVAVVKRGAA